MSYHSNKSNQHHSRHCLFCEAPLTHTMVDLGMSPLCESYLQAESLNAMEPFYPLHVMVCGQCLLVQLDQYVSEQEIFSEYAYFSSYSEDWLKHAQTYVEAISARLALNESSQVVELASNDGYLLQHFLAKKIPVLGIEPAANVAQAAIEKGIETQVAFFDAKFAEELSARGCQADLIIGNNVLAQVPKIKSFVAGIQRLLAPTGTVTIEFPHLLKLMDENQLDTIYHEHFFYFSLHSAERLFSSVGLTIYDVETLWTHGGSLRLFLRHAAHEELVTSPRVEEIKRVEEDRGLTDPAAYGRFADRAVATKRKILQFLIDAKHSNQRIAGYGAPGKGNTLLNYCGIRTDFIDYTVDRNPYKHGRFLPGTHIPIYPPDEIARTKPDYIFILPWNLKDEIINQLSYVREWGGQFVVPIPDLTVVP